MLRVLCLLGIVVCTGNQRCFAEVEVKAERSNSSFFDFRSIPLPAVNDAAADAKIEIISGEVDENGKSKSALNDGQVPSSNDQPSSNFFFAGGDEGRRILFDLGKVVNVKSVASYSWHPDERAPQVYSLYAAKGDEDGFVSSLKSGTKPEDAGWTFIAHVDTNRRRGPRGGQHAAMIQDSKDNLGSYRYLLFDVSKSVEDSPFGETFYSEIDVIDADADEVKRIEKPNPVLITFSDKSKKYLFTIDATLAPDLEQWSKDELRPVVMEWYPKIVELLTSEGYDPPKNVTLRFQNDMGGIPAWAAGPNIALNIGWYRQQLQGEALGAAVHELVHVAQVYPHTRREDAKPGWIVEGIPDYIRWFLYEPQTGGADITARSLPRARYDASYRVTGNFLDWASKTYDKDLVPKLNASVREGKYSSQFWKDTTGLSEEELNKAWIDYHRARLNQK